MDIKDLFLSCRRGDLQRVQYLVEQKEVELNVRDKWDSTPLYYACLCGHGELVTYLLENGARCEPNTFDGERCLYGALNNYIRNILKNFKQVTASCMRRDNYTEFLRRLLDRGVYSDVMFDVHGQMFSAHRCILSVRSRYFRDKLSGKWADRRVVTIRHQLVQPWVFKALLSWLYTGKLDVHVDDVEDLIPLIKQCQLDNLLELLEEKKNKVLSFESTKPGVKVTVLSLEPNPQVLKADFGQLAGLALPTGFCDQEASPEFPFLPQDVQLYPDVVYRVDGYVFHCHQAFFCSRSDYFKVLDEDHFGEKSYDPDTSLPVITIYNISASVFAQVLNYMYEDCCEITVANCSDILVAGDMFLLTGLKRYCASVMCGFTDAHNVITMLRTARLFNLPKLEDMCAEIMADNIEMMVQLPEFADVVREDATGVRDRQETDSIPIIDDIRFHLTNTIQTFSDVYEADQKISLIDSFLDTLELDA